MKPYKILSRFVKLDLYDKGNGDLWLNDLLFTKEDQTDGNENLAWAFSSPGASRWEFKHPKAGLSWYIITFFDLRTGYFSISNWEQITWFKLFIFPFWFLKEKIRELSDKLYETIYLLKHKKCVQVDILN